MSDNIFKYPEELQLVNLCVSLYPSRTDLIEDIPVLHKNGSFLVIIINIDVRIRQWRYDLGVFKASVL